MTDRKHVSLGGADDFVLRSLACADMDVLAGAVLKAIAPFGMSAAASGLVSGPKITTPDLFHFTHWPADWVALYMAEEFYLCDPVPRWARNSGRPITWRNLFKRLSARDPGRKVIEAAVRFGFTEGMIVPTRGADNSLAAVSFGGGRGPLSEAEQAALTIIAAAAFRAADRIAGGSSGRAAPVLSPREIECLGLMVQGHDDARIARLTGVSVRTVRFHLAAVRRKFGVGSRIHLAAVAIAQGYVAP
jgi:DNA-binding CsgD family transcriptional regulator